ncbi:MAG: ABC-2 type transport system permease protein [Planctomycetota bacterium]|jgi:ABC-2 type transport system permease protein
MIRAMNHLLHFEWLRITRSPMRAYAIIVFVLCGVYAIASGVEHVKDWEQTLEELQTRESERRDQALTWFDAGLTGPEDRTYIDVSEPRWADSYAAAYWTMKPEPLSALAIGLSDIRGSWVSISATTGSQPFETSDPGTLGNAEKLLAGNFDLVFVLAYLTPLLLLILLFDVGGLERDLGMMRLVRTQVASSGVWMIRRVALPVLVVTGLVALLCVIGGVWSGALGSSSSSWLIFAGTALGYTVLWGVLFSVVLAGGAGTSTAALWMVGLWLGICVLVPAAVRQVVSQNHPVLFATELTTTLRSERYEILLSDVAEYEQGFYQRRPELARPSAASSSDWTSGMSQFIKQAEFLKLVDEVTDSLIRDETAREAAVARFGMINPAYVFQRSLCVLAGTESDSYRAHRNDVLSAVAARLETLIEAQWNERSFDRAAFENLFVNGASKHYGSIEKRGGYLNLLGLLGGAVLMVFLVASIQRKRERKFG